jgi:hypothetical protein
MKSSPNKNIWRKHRKLNCILFSKNERSFFQESLDTILSRR